MSKKIFLIYLLIFLNLTVTIIGFLFISQSINNIMKNYTSQAAYENYGNLVNEVKGNVSNSFNEHDLYYLNNMNETTADNLLILANSELKNENFEKAKELYLSDKLTNSSIAQYNLSYIFYMEEQYDLTTHFLNKAIELDNFIAMKTNIGLMIASQLEPQIIIEEAKSYCYSSNIEMCNFVASNYENKEISINNLSEMKKYDDLVFSGIDFYEDYYVGVFTSYQAVYGTDTDRYELVGTKQIPDEGHVDTVYTYKWYQKINKYYGTFVYQYIS